jgi:hypothetical protein
MTTLRAKLLALFFFSGCQLVEGVGAGLSQPRPDPVYTTDTPPTSSDAVIPPEAGGGSDSDESADTDVVDTDVVDTDDQVETVDTDVVDTDIIPWVDTDVPAAPLEDQILEFTKVTDTLFPPGSLVPGWSHSPEGVVETHWTTCTQGYPGESPEAWVCLFYNKQNTGEVGIFRRLQIELDGTWTWHPLGCGINDMVDARLIDGPVGIFGPADPNPGPKLHQLRFAKLQDSSGNSRLVLLVGGAFGPVFEPDPAQVGTWRQELNIRTALTRDLGLNQMPTGYSWTWDVDGDGRLDLLLMKARKVNMADPAEPTGLVIVYALPSGGWKAKLYGSVGGHNDVYTWQIVGEPGSGPPMIAALGSAGPASTEVWEARDAYGNPIYDAEGFPAYAQSMALGSGIGAYAPMGAAQLDLSTASGLPLLAVATSDSTLCHKVWFPSGGYWWETSTATRNIVPFGTIDARQGKCTWDFASLRSREIPWGMVVLNPHQTLTVWGHDTTQHQQCGPEAMARLGYQPPADCPPVSRPTVNWNESPLPGEDHGEMVTYPADHVVILDQSGVLVPDRNDRFADGVDFDNDGDVDILVGGAFEGEAHVLRNEATGPRFCVTLHGTGPTTGNNELGLGAKIVVTDRTTGEQRRRWVDHNANCFEPESRDPSRTQIEVRWPNDTVEFRDWDGQSSTVPFTE